MPKVSLDVWVQRTSILESALGRAGRADLLPAVNAAGRLLATLAKSDSDHVDEAMDLVGRTLARVRECVTDRRKVFESSLLQDVDAMCRRLAPARAVGPIARAPALTAPPPASWSGRAGLADTEPLDPLSLLESLGHAGDGDLDQLVESVGKIQRAAPRDELGTLREPIQGMRKAEATARVLMKGELHPGLLSDLIQLFSQNAETGRLVIEGGGSTANVYFKEGRIVDAECGAETGEKAFFLSMLIREGRFTYQRGVETAEVRIFRNAQHLIMDTLRLMDESM